MIKQHLVSLKLFDPDGTLSLTNIAVMVLIAKIATASAIDWQVVSALLITLVSYGHKRQLNARRAADKEASSGIVQDLEQKVQELFTILNLKKLK